VSGDWGGDDGGMRRKEWGVRKRGRERRRGEGEKGKKGRCKREAGAMTHKKEGAVTVCVGDDTPFLSLRTNASECGNLKGRQGVLRTGLRIASLVCLMTRLAMTG